MSNLPQCEADSILNRMYIALNYRIDQRCADLAVLIDRASKQELQSIFPILVDSIFGPQGTFSWNLRKITPESNATEYSNVMNFLKPQGAMFKMIYTLLQDATMKFDFNTGYLPLKVQQMLEDSNINPFYNEIIQYVNLQSSRQHVLLLNPFDYFIFHFAYHLINPCHQRVHTDENWNTAYYNLCAEYLFHFFPTQLDSQITPLINYSGKNPMQANQQFFRPYKQSTLLKHSLFYDPHVNEMKTVHQQFDKHPRNEIWRSETILMAIIDMWLSNDQVCSAHEPLKVSTNYPELPSGDYIRIIRITVKHLHAFVSTGAMDNSALGDLKKHTMPMMQTRMYVFLRNLLHRWPLDESFRLVMELWLSFIQPWRYSHESYNSRGGIFKTSTSHVINQSLNTQDEIKHADESYLQFIAENLLVYTVILQQLLPRFTRIDLSSPRNAHMLFRLTKVFNQHNLVEMLRSIESLVENKNYSPTHQTHTLNYSTASPPLSPNSKWPRNSLEFHSSTHIDTSDGLQTGPKYDCQLSKYLNLVRQKIYELEGPNFHYMPLFTGTSVVSSDVHELIKLVKSSEVRALRLLERSREKQKQSTTFCSLFSHRGNDMDEVSLQDRQKAPLFLVNSSEYLMEIFGIQDNQQYNDPPESPFKHITNLEEDMFPSILTPKKVRERLRSMKYQGDPDLMPIQSFEIAFLVRLFYIISTRINEQYGSKMYRVYYSTTFWGHVCSCLLQGPMQVFKYEKKYGSSRRIMYHLPPRLSLRKFAHRRFLIFLVGCVCLSTFFNWGCVTLVIIYAVAYSLRILLNATFRSRAMPSIDLNFNDSLDE